MALTIRYSYEHLLARRARSAATAAIIAMVVLAAALFSGLVSSIERTIVSTGSARNLVVLRKAASTDGSSFVTLEDYHRLRLLPEIARTAAGEPLVSPELVVEPSFARPNGSRENVLVRGVEPVALEVHDEVEITAGRMIRPSAGEEIVGRQILTRYGLDGGGAREPGRCAELRTRCTPPWSRGAGRSGRFARWASPPRRSSAPCCWNRCCCPSRASSWVADWRGPRASCWIAPCPVWA